MKGISNVEYWECCGRTIAKYGKCPVCGGSNPLLSNPQDCQLKRNVRSALGDAGEKIAPILKRGERVRITITRGYTRSPLDVDNMVGGAKPLRDAIARALHIDDAESENLEWVYKQEKGTGMKVKIEVMNVLPIKGERGITGDKGE